MDAQNLKPHRGTLILILGILGIFCCGIFTAIPAIIMGSGDLKAMDAERWTRQQGQHQCW